MTQSLLFDPLIPLSLLAGIGVLMTALCVLCAARRLPGWWLRWLASAVLVLALANPSLQTEDRSPLSDIVLLAVDESASQGLSDRRAQTEAALEATLARIADLGMDARIVRVGDGENNAGTRIMSALGNLLAETPRARVAGALILSDGQIHDAELAPDIPAPTHLLQTGRATDWDRRLSVRNAPAFAILDEEFTITLRADDLGAAPTGSGSTPVEISIDGDTPRTFNIPIGRDLEVPLVLPHGGMNVLQFTLPEAEGELTTRNNTAVVQINGVRDRLRVLLVSGQPHPGQRTWRNLLKADSSVDLVHFTILRPPGKQDGVPVTELSLIAFPTRELFLEKIDEFDLIIFDRYRRRGILSPLYLANVADYVARGGAVLVAAGPDFASADSLYRSPLEEIMPAAPTARVIEQGFTPEITEMGNRHPVTQGLEAYGPGGMDAEVPWGRWFRLTELTPAADTQTVMQGPDAAPLLVLDRVGEGRVALLASDHVWLWDRGFEGGGPQLELLRRLAHWMMKEPELEEEALTASAIGQVVTITRRALTGTPDAVVVTRPDGTEFSLALTEESPGRFVGEFTGTQQGLFRLVEGDQETVFALGPAAPREFVETIASAAPIAAVLNARRGGVAALEEGIPDLRVVREGRTATGRGWLGLTPREAFQTTSLRITSLVPPWLFLLFAALLTVFAWMREGRRST
jgi:hypothetical protein